MPTWTFDGAVLPDGEHGELSCGSGPVEALPGRFALAGLVDAHCHLTVAADEAGPYLADAALAGQRLRECAGAGVTVVRDVGGRSSITLTLAGELVDGRPRVLAAGRFLAPAGRYFPRMHEPVATERLLAAAEAELDRGATWLKLIADFPTLDEDGRPQPPVSPTYPADAVEAVIALAHRRGARVAAHATSELAADLVHLGVDSVEHGTRLAFEDVQQLGQRGGAWTPTLCASVGVGPDRDDSGARHSAAIREVLPTAVDAGVTVLAGTDVVGSLPAEVALLVEHGLSVEQALAAASTAARAYLGLADEPTESTDLVTYDADPREDPAVLRSPAAVVIRGTRVR